MAIKTIPQLQEATSADENTLIPIDSGIQSYKITLPNLAKGMEKFTSSISRWDSDRTYDEGDIVNHEGLLFKSVENDNTDIPGLSAKWIPELFLSEISVESSPQKGDLFKGKIVFTRTGKTVTVSGWIEQYAAQNAYIISGNNFIPEWAIPAVEAYASYPGETSVIFRLYPIALDHPVTPTGLIMDIASEGTARAFAIKVPNDPLGMDGYYNFNVSYVAADL